jgi:uncharacterized membrane protein YpjA
MLKRLRAVRLDIMLPPDSGGTPTRGSDSPAPQAWPNPLREPIAFFGRFKAHAGWALLIGAINLLGIVYGFIYYEPQFAVTPWYLWLFVPDSPLAVLWAELALLAAWLGRRVMALEALAFVGNVQVGLWTVYVLLAYAPEFGTLDFLHGGPVSLNTILLVGHFGMAVLALIFVQGIRDCRSSHRGGRALVGIAIALAYYLANDALDYFGPNFNVGGADAAAFGCAGMRPYTVPCDPAREPALMAVTFALTLLATAALWALTRPPAIAAERGGAPPEPTLDEIR